MKVHLMLKISCLSLLIFCLESCSQSKDVKGGGGYQVENAFPNLSFKRPVDLQHSGDNTNRLFVVEQAGLIYVFSNSREVDSKNVFLDLKSKVKDRGNEEGLLGLAFHPNYKSNGYFYVNYTAANPNRTVISRFKVSDANKNEANPNSEQVILEIPQPYGNHNGGQLAFGSDGYLYIAVGDGGSGGDPLGHGQNLTTMLGSILRIDIDNKANGKEYAIPADNPFAKNTNDYREEIYAYGLRNPWRFSFDKETGSLWTGDVGQDLYEEINIIVKGGNYGWNIMEGMHCFKPPAGCDTSGLILPVWEYGRKEGISVTGGFVYRGKTMAGLIGKYIYGDFGSGNIWALDVSNKNKPFSALLLKTKLNIASFGTDQNNELYICSFDGKIYRLNN
jgi:glucose/arabinose dehydrogenase